MANVRITVCAIAVCCLSALPLAAQSPSQTGEHPQDLYGWRNARWAMSEHEVKSAVRGRWRTATKEEREDERDLYVPFVLQDIELGGTKFIGLFGFSKTDRRLVAITLHSGIPLIKTAGATALFNRLLDDEQKQLGVPRKIIRNNSGHTGFYADYAVWRFPSTVVELTCVRPNDSERAVTLSYAVPSEADKQDRSR